MTFLFLQTIDGVLRFDIRSQRRRDADRKQDPVTHRFRLDNVQISFKCITSDTVAVTQVTWWSEGEGKEEEED